MSEYCPHCHGSTRCYCATCGKTITVEESDHHGKILKKEKQIEGICQVCKGTGRETRKKT